MTPRTRAAGALSRPALGPVDPVLGAIVTALIGFGIVMVYSASAVEATVQMHDPHYYLKRQAIFGVGALVTMWAVSAFDYHRLRKLTYWNLAFVVLTLVVCISGLGHSGGGARRWISLGPIHVQPAEMAKLALVMWLAYSLEKKAERVTTFLVGFLPHVIVPGVLMLLCLKQPDFGSAVVLAFLSFTLMFVAGARIGYLAIGTFLAGGGAVALVVTQSYRLRRYLAWLDMDKHRQDLAYQPFQSVMSFGSGGALGLGLGRGLQVLYLPEAHTDFIAAIVGEELGFLGVLGLCAAYLVIVARGVRIAVLAPDDYGSYLSFGISTMFGVQALVNLAVAMAIAPTKGLTLPFMSYGGSSLLVNAVAAGILLNISRQGTKMVPVEASSERSSLAPEQSPA